MTEPPTRRRFIFGAAGAAMGFTAARATARDPAGPELRPESQFLQRRLSGGDNGPVVDGQNALITFSQVRNGHTRGDAVFLVRDESMKPPYVEQTYIMDNGAYESGRWITISQKRDVDGKFGQGPRIQGVSSLPDGSEPSMIAASTDIDGPAFAGEAYTSRKTGQRNCSVFAAYDLDDVHGGSGAYSPGYGRKRFVIRGDGGLWWGPDLGSDPWTRADVRLERVRPGHLRVLSPLGGRTAMLEVASRSGESSILRMSVEGGTHVDLVVDDEHGLGFSTGQDDRSTCGVDLGGAFRDRVVKQRSGPPSTGTWSAGACVVNLADDRVYWCVQAGSPGRWRSTQLR